MWERSAYRVLLVKSEGGDRLEKMGLTMVMKEIKWEGLDRFCLTHG